MSAAGQGSPRKSRLPKTIGPFSVDALLGSGGMGEVYRVHDPEFHRELALKVSKKFASMLDPVVARFLAEGRLTGQLQHPVIPPIYTLGQHQDGRWFYTMRRIRGRTLGAVLRALADGDAAARETWTLRRLVSVVVTVCQGAGYAHGRGVIHRDLKPHNIMLGEHGEVYLLDWGLAKALGRNLNGPGGEDPAGTVPPPASASPEDEVAAETAAPSESSACGSGSDPSSFGESSLGNTTYEAYASGPLAPGARPHGHSSSMWGAGSDPESPIAAPTREGGGEDGEAPSDQLTSDGQVLGTPGYMAPEQALCDTARQDQRTDVYALGAILWEILAGQPLRAGLKGKELLAAAREGRRPSFRDAAAGRRVEPELQAICQKALEPDPAARHASALALAAELQDWLDGRPRWTLAFEQDFAGLPDTDEAPKGWAAVAGAWGIRGGALCVRVADNAVLRLDRPFGPNVRVELEGEILEDKDGDVGELSAILRAPARPLGKFLSDGYCFQFGAENMQATKLARNDGDLIVLPERRPQAGRRHTVRAEAHEETLRLWIDEQLCFTVRDRFPLEGHHVALYGFATAARIRRVRVWTAGVPRRRSCVAVPDAFAARGLWAEALAEYDRIRASYPGSAEADEALFKSAICLMELSRADEARERLAMLEATPLAPLACVCQSAILQRAEASPEAEAAVLAGGLARSYGPHAEGVQDLHLRAHLRARDFKLAEHYGAAIKLWQILADTREAPEFLRVSALMDLGNVLANEGDYTSARAACQRLVDEFPHLPAACSSGMTLLANALQRQGLHEQARRTAKQVLERFSRLDTRHVHAQLILGRAWAAEGFFEKAREVLEHLIAEYSGQPNYVAQARHLIGRCLYMEGRDAEARAAWAQNEDVYAPALVPSSNSLVDIAWLDLEAGDEAAARRRLAQVMEFCREEREGHRSRRAAALSALGHLEARAGREAEALEIFGRIPTEYPDWSSTGAHALAAAARLHLRRRRVEEARACCERILKEAARTKDLRALGERHLGLVDRARGDGAAAAERWTEIAQREPLGQEARVARLWKALADLDAGREGDFHGALEDLAVQADRHGWFHEACFWMRCLGSAPGHWASDAAGTPMSPATVRRRTPHGDRDEFLLMLELRAGLDPAWREAVAGLVVRHT